MSPLDAPHDEMRAADAEGRRPVLRLRATPGVSFAPANVLLVAELVGGDTLEEFYCPEIEWDFDDGRRSTSQSECEPFGPDSALERRFLVRASYARAGEYRPAITLRRSDGVVARAAAIVLVPSSSAEGGRSRHPTDRREERPAWTSRAGRRLRLTRERAGTIPARNRSEAEP